MITQPVVYYFSLYFNEHCEMIPIDLRKQQALDADPEAIQQINFTESLDRAESTTFFIIEEAKQTILDFSQGPAKVLRTYFDLMYNINM